MEALTGTLQRVLARYTNTIGLYAALTTYITAFITNLLAAVLCMLVTLGLEDPGDNWMAAYGDEHGEDLVGAGPPKQYVTAVYFVITTVSGCRAWWADLGYLGLP